MVVAENYLPEEAELGLHPERPGPIQAIPFEHWPQDPERPVELIGGWILAMSPIGINSAIVLSDLNAALHPIVRRRGWSLAFDGRHRLARPSETVVFPDLVVHCIPPEELRAGGETVTRTPDLVIEILGEETAERDRAPHGAKFLAYQLSGVREYFYAWPDGREAAGFRLEGDAYQPIEPDGDGFLRSGVLGVSLRLVPAALRDVTPSASEP